MKTGILPETLLERAALWLGVVPVPVVDLLFALLKARAIMSGVSLGVFEALRNGRRSATDLASELNCDEPALDRLLRTLVHSGYLTERAEAYSLSPLARQTMLRGAPMELTGYARWNESQWHFLDALDALVQTGRGIDFHRTLADSQAWGHYQRAMLELSRLDARTLAGRVPVRRGATRLLDLAGSHGLLGAAICRRHPPMRSTVIDLPQALEHGRTLAHEAGHAGLVDHVAGNLLVDPIPSADVILLSNVLHHLTPAETQELLARARGSLTPDGTIAIWEVEAPRAGLPAGHGDVAALYFRLTSSSETPHGEDYAQWLAASGFQRVRQSRPPLAPGRVLIVGRQRPLPKSNRNPQTSRLRQEYPVST